jgi:hypothetical protein
MLWQPCETKGFLMFRHVVHTFINGRSKVKELNSFGNYHKTYSAATEKSMCWRVQPYCAVTAYCTRECHVNSCITAGCGRYLRLPKRSWIRLPLSGVKYHAEYQRSGDVLEEITFSIARFFHFNSSGRWRRVGLKRGREIPEEPPASTFTLIVRRWRYKSRYLRIRLQDLTHQ